MMSISAPIRVCEVFVPQTVCPHAGVLTVGVRPGLDQGDPFRPWHFCPKFSRKTSLVRCPCAFRLRRLAQRVGRGFGLFSLRHFHLKNLHKHFLVRCPCAFRLRRLA